MNRSTPRTSEVGRLIQEGALRAVFQPIVELSGRSTVGYESLIRGPQGSKLEMPVELFGAAGREGVLAELDRACRRTALATFGEERPGLLFLNAEPLAIDAEAMADLPGRVGDRGAPVVVEMTERALTARPSEVLAAVRMLRDRGCRIALDDVGADRRSLALMPFLSPDVIKLDMALTHDSLPPDDTARVITAVGAEVERCGALVVAEGIETEEHLWRAEALGATLGQGWLFGRPGPLPDGDAAATELPAARASAGEVPRETPFEFVAGRRPTRRADEDMLTALSQHLEREAGTLGGEAVVVSLFQDARFFTPDTRRRYEGLAEEAALVCAMGPGMSDTPGEGVRGSGLETDDRLRGEWVVAVLGPHFAAALVARETGDRNARGREVFDHCMTYDRDLVVETSDRLLRRVIGGGQDADPAGLRGLPATDHGRRG